MVITHYKEILYCRKISYTSSEILAVFRTIDQSNSYTVLLL